MILLLLFMSVAVAPGLPTPEPCPITVELNDQLHPTRSRARVACDVERQLRRAGWGDDLVEGALVNAWHESGWNSRARGDSGRGQHCMVLDTVTGQEWLMNKRYLEAV